MNYVQICPTKEEFDKTIWRLITQGADFATDVTNLKITVYYHDINSINHG